MSIIIAEPSVEERIRQRVESGQFASVDDVVARALDDMDLVERRRAERARKVEQLRALVAEGDADFERGDFVEWTPTLLDEILADARAASRRGDPIPDHVKP